MSDWLTIGNPVRHNGHPLFVAGQPQERADGLVEILVSAYPGLYQPFEVMLNRLERVVTVADIEAAEQRIAELEKQKERLVNAVETAKGKLSPVINALNLNRLDNALILATQAHRILDDALAERVSVSSTQAPPGA